MAWHRHPERLQMGRTMSDERRVLRHARPRVSPSVANFHSWWIRAVAEVGSVRSFLCAVAVFAVASSGLAACSSGSGSVSNSSVPVSAGSGVAASCSRRAITAGAETFARQNASTFDDVQSFGCSGSFAYAIADISAQGNENSVTVLLMKRAGMWVPVSRHSYCADHAVPDSIYFNACETQ